MQSRELDGSQVAWSERTLIGEDFFVVKTKDTEGVERLSLSGGKIAPDPIVLKSIPRPTDDDFIRVAAIAAGEWYRVNPERFSEGSGTPNKQAIREMMLSVNGILSHFEAGSKEHRIAMFAEKLSLDERTRFIEAALAHLKGT